MGCRTPGFAVSLSFVLPEVSIYDTLANTNRWQFWRKCDAEFLNLFSVQSYPHKILTGRRDRMPTIRQTNGLSGFTKRSESEYDSFGTGHSSTSISAALGNTTFPLLFSIYILTA